MKNFIEEIKSILSKRELIPKLISLMLAVILWAYIGSTKIGELKFRSIIDLRNLPVHLVVSKIQTLYLNITLNGKKEDLKTINSKNIKSYINLENAKPGNNLRYSVEISKNRIPENIEVAYSPNKIFLSIEKRVKKLVRVIPDIAGKPKSGFTLGNISINPEYIFVSGPETVVNEMSTVKTSKIFIHRESSTIKKSITLDKVNLKNIDFSTSNVNIVIPIIESSNLFEFSKTAELRNKNSSFNYELLSDNNIKVYIKATSKDAGLTEDDFEAYVDLSSINIIKRLKKNNLQNIIIDYPIKVLIKSKKEIIKFSYTIPEKISLNISKK